MLALLAILIAAGCAGWPASRPPTVVFLPVESSAAVQAPDVRLMLELMNGR